MTGYVRKDTTNNIADGNVINAADLDAEFDGVQDAFNASTGHKHDGTAGEGATINALGPTQDVTISSTLLAPKTTNTVDIGSSSLKFKDLFLAGNGSVGGTLAVTGVATFTAQPILSSLTASRAVFSDGSKGLVSNAITGTGNVVMSASPTLTGTAGFENITASGTLGVTGVATFTAQPIVSSLTASRAVFSDGSKGLVSNAITGTGNVVMSASPTLTGTIAAEALTASSSVTLSGGTANGVAYLNGSKVLTSGSALTFDGTTLTNNNSGQGFLQTNTSASTYASFKGNTGGTTIWTGIGTDTGISWLGSVSNHDVVFRQNNTEGMRLTSTGLGIGTSSPLTKLNTYQTGGGALATFGTNTGLAYIIVGGQSTTAYHTRFGYDVTNEYGYIQSIAAAGVYDDIAINPLGGNVGIGTSSPSAKLHVYKSNQNQLQLQCDDTGQVNINMGGTTTPAKGAIYFSDNSGSMWFNTASTQRMTLDSSGNLGLGVTPSAWKSDTKAIQVSNTGAGIWSYTSGGTADEYAFFVNNSYLNSAANNIYVRDGAAAQYRLFGGTHAWFNASSGTAGNAISFTQAMTLDASGRLGIGSTSPNTPLTFANAVGKKINFYESSDYSIGVESSELRIATGATSGGGGAGITFYTGGYSGTERARIDSSGNLIVADTTAAYSSSGRGNITIGGSSTSLLGFRVGSVNKGYLLHSGTNLDISNTAAGYLAFSTDASERARINATGRFEVSYSTNNGSQAALFTNSAATAGNQYGLGVTLSSDPNGSSTYFLQCLGNATNRTTILANGGIQNYSANNSNLSDRREKTNFAPATSYLDKICAIPVQTFNYIDQNLEEDDGLTLGVVAQDVQAVAPELVMESNWGTEEEPKMRLSIYQTDLQYALMKALQELKAEFDAYKASHP